ncbi:MAG TPA: DUF3038 domain-containing protein [Leptolyngbyaceae cyanobacterium M65_K2018_010]|nr:DUF3038 domain-containing protein [Leptolyngbyaceae cyanobacterium M65_K2018_010]
MERSSQQPGQSLAKVSATPQQLRSIKAQLDLVLLALEALTGVGSEAMLATAASLGLSELLSDRVNLWRLRQASPLRTGQGRKKLDVDEARALVLVSGHLAAQHRATIRQAVAHLEKALEQGRPPHRVALLGNYLDSFSNAYQDRMEADPTSTPDDLTPLALKLLIDLLFYSGPEGDRRLWSALLDRSLS